MSEIPGNWISDFFVQMKSEVDSHYNTDEYWIIECSFNCQIAFFELVVKKHVNFLLKLVDIATFSFHF